jgi:hypothetical protein
MSSNKLTVRLAFSNRFRRSQRQCQFPVCQLTRHLISPVGKHCGFASFFVLSALVDGLGCTFARGEADETKVPSPPADFSRAAWCHDGG